MTDQLAAPGRFTLRYKVAPLSICREEKGNICLIVDVLDAPCVLILPVPYWFRKKTWKKYTLEGGQQTASSNGARGLVYSRTKVEERGVWDYVEDVVRAYVTQMLTERNLAGFTLEIPPRKPPK